MFTPRRRWSAIGEIGGWVERAYWPPIVVGLPGLRALVQAWRGPTGDLIERPARLDGVLLSPARFFISAGARAYRPAPTGLRGSEPSPKNVRPPIQMAE